MTTVEKNTTFRDRAAARKGSKAAAVKAVEADEAEVENKAVGAAETKAAPKARRKPRG